MKQGGIIWENERMMAFRKRGTMVLNSVQRDKGSVGWAGSDRINEDGYDGFRETMEPILNENRQPLRFALIARNALALRARLSNGEPLAIATSYPATANRLLGPGNRLVYVPGGVEGELRDRDEELDAGFELVQSGDSVRQNGLEIVEDDIEFIMLECVRTPYDW